ncbi:MAG: OST-HTH/LOTUS domain-containing protein, partial [Polaribacter sp.]|nr:OST-HTH/LOTUS domain-containing protein [Polaribacter sp.]
IYIEILKHQSSENELESLEATNTKGGYDKITQKEIRFIASTIDDVSDDDGWAFLGDVGSLLQKKQPNFDSRNYGFQKLTPLIKSISNFQVERRFTSKGHMKLIYVKIKEVKGKVRKK